MTEDPVPDTNFVELSAKRRISEAVNAKPQGMSISGHTGRSIRQGAFEIPVHVQQERPIEPGKRNMMPFGWQVDGAQLMIWAIPKY